jgi:hypothetical protein
MSILWDREFDRVCGANITCSETKPLEDSGVWDILYGPEQETEVKELTRQRAKTFHPVPHYRGGSCPFSGK